MIKVNDNFTQLSPSYLFTDIAKKVSDYQQAHPEAHIIRMGIGDVTRPICQAAIKALHRAVDDEASADTFHGYGPEQGYAFLRDAIAEHDYRSRGIEIFSDEIFISDGAKSDTGNIGDILSPDCRVAVTDPVYPVYVDTNVMAGRAGCLRPDGTRERLEYLPCTAENGFSPALPTGNPDVIYLCFPNNPTGTALTRAQLKPWVDYALAHNALLLFDSAYEAYVSNPDIPRSIYEIEGARRCAIEFRSFSKTAGFTGLRCGYTVVPRDLAGRDSEGREVSLHALWLRRQSTKFNGTSYIIKKGAQAVFSPEGMAQCQENIRYYQHNARLIADALRKKNIRFFGGIHSPYIWFECPNNMESWEFFDYLLNHAQIVGTPGAGFGENGTRYFRLTAFGSHENTEEAMERFEKLF